VISDDELSDAQLRARKVKPQYGEGPLVKVAWARNQSEAELISGLLLEEGVPSVIRRNGGFDVPDFLAAGPRDVLVAASGEDIAREALAIQERVVPQTRTSSGWVRLLAVTVIIVLGVSSLAGAAAALLY
jgi:hypothetical protein